MDDNDLRNWIKQNTPYTEDKKTSLGELLRRELGGDFYNDKEKGATFKKELFLILQNHILDDNTLLNSLKTNKNLNTFLANEETFASILGYLIIHPQATDSLAFVLAQSHTILNSGVMGGIEKIYKKTLETFGALPEKRKQQVLDIFEDKKSYLKISTFFEYAIFFGWDDTASLVRQRLNEVLPLKREQKLKHKALVLTHRHRDVFDFDDKTWANIVVDSLFYFIHDTEREAKLMPCILQSVDDELLKPILSAKWREWVTTGASSEREKIEPFLNDDIIFYLLNDTIKAQDGVLHKRAKQLLERAFIYEKASLPKKKM